MNKPPRWKSHVNYFLHEYFFTDPDQTAFIHLLLYVIAEPGLIFILPKKKSPKKHHKPCRNLSTYSKCPKI